MEEAQKVLKITAAGTINLLSKTGYFLAIIVSIVTPGSLAITIQDKATPVNKLLPPIDLTPPGGGTDIMVKSFNAPQPVRMDGGIDVVTTGAGEVYLWIWYLFQPELQP